MAEVLTLAQVDMASSEAVRTFGPSRQTGEEKFAGAKKLLLRIESYWPDGITENVINIVVQYPRSNSCERSRYV